MREARCFFGVLAVPPALPPKAPSIAAAWRMVFRSGCVNRPMPQLSQSVLGLSRGKVRLGSRRKEDLTCIMPRGNVEITPDP